MGATAQGRASGRRRAGLAALLGLALLALAGGPVRAAPTAPDDLIEEAFMASQYAIGSGAEAALALLAARFASRADGLGALVRDRETLRSREAALEARITKALADSDIGAADRRRTLNAEIREVRDALGAIDRRITALDPAFLELASPRALPVTQARALLNPDEGLLLLLEAPEGAYAFGLSRDGLRWHRADDLGAAVLRGEVDRLRSGLAAFSPRGPLLGDLDDLAGGDRSFDRATAYALYDRLVRPVEPAFAGRSRLLVVVSGALSALPLGVLATAPPEPGPNGPEVFRRTAWLHDRYAIASLPNVSSLLALRCLLAAVPHPGCPAVAPRAAPVPPLAGTAARLDLVGYGDPVLGAAGTGRIVVPIAAGQALTGGAALADPARLRTLTALPGTRRELEALRRQFPASRIRLGMETTETAVKTEDRAALASARFIVFATHGLLAGADGIGALGEPALVLTPPDRPTALDDGALTASEVAELDLAAEFVVLSACNTAAADGRPGGEGLSGLARAFFYAGARALLASHWAVSDAATERLIITTFRQLDSSGRVDRAKALQQAAIGVRNTPERPDWAHPAYWGAFSYVGE